MPIFKRQSLQRPRNARALQLSNVKILPLLCPDQGK
jgi:hypothetical protein